MTRGQPLFAIDGQPVVLFYGELPLFRSLRFQGSKYTDFQWLELNNARDDERRAELNLTAQRARVKEMQAQLEEVRTYVADTPLEQPKTPQFIRLSAAVTAARDQLRRIEQLAEKKYATAAEVQKARVDLAAAQAELDLSKKDKAQQLIAAEAALANASVAVQGAERALRDAHDVSNALLSSAKDNLDIDILRKNLEALGYKGATDTAVRSWQRASGRSATGLIEPGQIVVAPGPIRVAAHLAEIGAVVYSRVDGLSGLAPSNNSSNQVVRYTSTEKIVTVPLEVADHDYAKPGDAVVVTLPTDVKVSGVIRKVGAQFDAKGQANTEIEIADQAALGSLEAASVDVEFVIGKRSDVLAVPIIALVALSEGGFGIEVVEGNTSRLLPVSTGLFARGSVEISGKGIAEGLTVRVPK